MAKLLAGRVVSALITAGGWLVTGARLVLDAIGYSTVPDDVAVAQSRLDQGIGYLVGLPWWAPLGFATIATMWLMYVSWPRQTALSERPRPVTAAPVKVHAPPPKTGSASETPKPEAAAERQAKHKLATFVVRFVLPACDAQEDLQQTALRKTCVENSSTHKLAKYGLRHWPSHEEFYECRDRLAKIKEDNASSVAFNALMDDVLLMSNRYHGYASFIIWICTSAGIDFHSDPDLKPLFDKCTALNEHLELQYKQFQDNTDFPKLNSLAQDRRQGRAFVAIV